MGATPDPEVDVVVVGAGLSGLIAARDLVRGGRTVRVLEAADRCGGRALSESTALGSRIDLGGQWIGHDHHRLAALVDELGATRFAMHTRALPLLVDGPRRLRPLSPSVLLALGTVAFAEVARRVRPGRRDRSVADWIARAPRPARRLLEVAALISWTTDLDRVSTRTARSMIAAQHGAATMLGTKGGAQDSLVTEGAGFLVDRLADELTDQSDVVRRGTAVLAIARDDDGVTVRTADGDLRARRVVITAPPPTAARIAHDPPLPAARRALEQESSMGSVYKAIAVYPEAFWRSGPGGELLMLDHPGMAVFDTSAPGGPGHLCLLVGGDEARTLDALTPDARRASLLARIATHLGPGVLTPSGWHEKAWHLDPHAGGGYLALPDLGAAASEVPLPAAPIGRLHWAGSETAADHPGYLDGAIESGQRVAAEVLRAPV